MGTRGVIRSFDTVEKTLFGREEEKARIIADMNTPLAYTCFAHVYLKDVILISLK